MANGTDKEPIGHRDILAFSVLVFSVLGVSTLAGIIVWKKPDDANVVMTAVLPLLGSWVGTVLAFYFSKDNFAAATRSVTEMAKQITSQEKLQATLAKEKMIPKEKMFLMREPATTKLKDILDKLAQANKGMRIPFLEANDYPRYIIHRSMIDQFLADRALKGASDLADLTLADLLEDAELKKKIEQGFASVKDDATLADVKKEMDKNPNCQDVFVTRGGTKDEATLGWITNVIIEDSSKV